MVLGIIVNGLTAGSLYALVAVSYNILYRPTNVFNFAQGDLVMLGAMLAVSAIAAYHLPWPIAALIAVVSVGLLCWLEERVAVAPILRRAALSTAWIISTLAFSLILANLVGRIWGPDPLRLAPPPPFSNATFPIWGTRVSSLQIALIVGSLLIVGAVEMFYKTRVGKAILAVAEDRDAALLRGINPDRLSQYSFLFGGMFAALAGLLAGSALSVSVGLGALLMIKGFQAAAIGGIGSNIGAAIAGYLMGLTEAIGATFLSPGYQQVLTFALFLGVLVVVPQGLFGRVVTRSV